MSHFIMYTFMFDSHENTWASSFCHGTRIVQTMPPKQTRQVHALQIGVAEWLEKVQNIQI